MRFLSHGSDFSYKPLSISWCSGRSIMPQRMPKIPSPSCRCDSYEPGWPRREKWSRPIVGTGLVAPYGRKWRRAAKLKAHLAVYFKRALESSDAKILQTRVNIHPPTGPQGAWHNYHSHTPRPPRAWVRTSYEYAVVTCWPANKAVLMSSRAFEGELFFGFPRCNKALSSCMQ